WSDRAVAARRRSAARARVPRAAGEGIGRGGGRTAWSRRELRLPLTRHNYVDINLSCQSRARSEDRSAVSCRAIRWSVDEHELEPKTNDAAPRGIAGGVACRAQGAPQEREGAHAA